MKKDKNNKKSRIENLRNILDTPDNKNLYPDDEKYLKSLARRLKESADEEHTETFVKFDGKEQDNDYLKPHVVVYPRKEKEEKKIEEKKIATTPPKKFITIDAEKKKVEVKGEELFEIEKIEKKERKFVKVKPKETVKQKKTKKTVKQKKTKKQQEESSKEKELTEWEAVDAEKPKIEKETKEEDWNSADLGKFEIEEKKEEPKPEKFVEVKKVDKKEKALPIKKVEFKVEEPEPEKFEEIDIEEKIEHEEVEDSAKTEIFKDIQTIDDETAILLYDNGFTSIESLRLHSIRDLCKKTGIKKSKVKKIKKEIDRTLKPKKTKKKKEKKAKEEKVQENFDKEEILPFKETPVEVEPLDVADTAEWKISADELIDEEEVSPNKIKIDSFKEMKSIDDKTAILLYDNGYTSVDYLKKATEDELKQIKGLKKKKVKEIMDELKELIKESVKGKDIEIDLAANAILTKDQLKDDIDDNNQEILLSDSVVELESDKAEWIPLPEENADKEEKKEFVNKKIKKDKISDEEKIKAFKDLETVDDVTAIILYNGGIKSINDIKKATIKKLTKIKGIKKNLAKQIKEESDKYETVEDAIKKDDEIKLIDDEDVNEEEFSLLDSQISNHFKTIDVEDFEKEEKRSDNFKEIKSINKKIAKLLIENGIYSIDDLRGQTIKDLTKIKGIRKKIAKEIKKEVESIKIEKPKKKNSKKKKSKKSKQYYVSKKNNNFQIFNPEQFIDEDEICRHNGYTLYEKEIQTESKKRTIIRFFSKEKPDDSYPIKLPDGYEAVENGTGVPYLKKKK